MLQAVRNNCEALAKVEYIERHNKAAAFVHRNICNDLEIKTGDNWH